jgi:hypothetical protein
VFHELEPRPLAGADMVVIAPGAVSPALSAAAVADRSRNRGASVMHQAVLNAAAQGGKVLIPLPANGGWEHAGREGVNVLGKACEAQDRQQRRKYKQN